MQCNCLSITYSPSDQLPGMDADCLRCLCNDKVGSNCHQPTVCTDPGTEFCDLIYFDIDYWTKAGRLVRAGDSTDNIDGLFPRMKINESFWRILKKSFFLAYINCRRSTDCAARTVLSFLEVSRNETGVRKYWCVFLLEFDNGGTD